MCLQIIIIDFSLSRSFYYSVGVGTSELFVTAYVTRGKDDNNNTKRDPFWECGDFNNYLYIRQFTKISTTRVKVLERVCFSHIDRYVNSYESIVRFLDGN